MQEGKYSDGGGKFSLISSPLAKPLDCSSMSYSKGNLLEGESRKALPGCFSYFIKVISKSKITFNCASFRLQVAGFSSKVLFLSSMIPPKPDSFAVFLRKLASGNILKRKPLHDFPLIQSQGHLPGQTRWLNLIFYELQILGQLKTLFFL